MPLNRPLSSDSSDPGEIALPTQVRRLRDENFAAIGEGRSKRVTRRRV